jgi:hypothetical protein
MNIAGKITGLKYKILLSDDLKEIDAANFDINEMPSACLLIDGTHIYAVSKWVSPKRTRSYPFERVFNTLECFKENNGDSDCQRRRRERRQGFYSVGHGFVDVAARCVCDFLLLQ